MNDLLSHAKLCVDSERSEYELELDGVFTIISARYYIDYVTLSSTAIGTRWCKLVSIKVNVLL